MPVRVQTLGHVVLKVRDLQRSEAFYSDLLGMRIVSRISEPRMTFLALATSRNHHDFALVEVGPHAQSPAHDVTGLAHVAFEIGNSVDELRRARTLLHDAGSPILYEAERGFAKSVHLQDPDGNEIELYVDTSSV